MAGLRALGRCIQSSLLSFFYPRQVPKAANSFVKPRASFLFFFSLPRLNYQRAATLLEIGTAGLQPLDRFISSDLSVSLPASLPLLHVSAFRSPLAVETSFSPPSECERRSKSIPFLISSRCAVDRWGKERRQLY